MSGLAVANTLLLPGQEPHSWNVRFNGIGVRAGNAAMEEVASGSENTRASIQRVTAIDTSQITRHRVC